MFAFQAVLNADVTWGKSLIPHHLSCTALRGDFTARPRKKEQTYRWQSVLVQLGQGKRNRLMAVSIGAAWGRKKEQIYGSQYWYNQGRKKEQTYRWQSVLVQLGEGKRNRPMAVSIGATRGRKKEQIYRSMTVSIGITWGGKRNRPINL